MSNRNQWQSRWQRIPRSRRLVTDVLYWHRRVPTTAHDRLSDFSPLMAARETANVRISWAVMFLKAYSLVAQKYAPLRQAFVKWPWPHLAESSHSVGMLVTHRDVAGEPWLFWARFLQPETTSLADLQRQLDRYQTDPVQDVFKRQWLMSALSMPLRRLFQWWTLHVGGSKRAKRAGTFALTTLGAKGVEIQHPPAFLTGNLTFGPLDENNRCRVTLAYDHRLLDGRMVADILTDLENTLNNIIAQELATSTDTINSIQTQQAAPASTRPDVTGIPSRPNSGRNAIITGASSGIGLAIARMLAASGYHLVLAARSRDKLEVVASELRQFGVSAIAVPTDMTDTAQLKQLVKTAREELGSIDILVNNAGIETYRHFHQTDLDNIEDAISLNLTAAIKLARLVIPHMLQQRRGHIINMSSLAGKHGPPFGVAYGASKAGLISMTQSLRAEYHGKGITATAICPGFTEDSGMYEKMKQEVGGRTPWQLGSTTTEAIANAALKSIERQPREVLLNFPPAGWVFQTAAIFPWLGERLLRLSAFRFLRSLANARTHTADQSTQRAA